MKLLTVLGARPQFIKAAALSRGLKDKDCIEVIVHTGQHYDANMSEIFFTELNIPAPKYNLEIKASKHGAMTGKMLEGIEGILLLEKPDYVIVYGDTNSTLAGALAAAKLSVPVIHIEAGLRSFNRNMPEEINRVVTDHLSEVLFAPSESSIKNLRNEGISSEKIHLVGDIMYDVAKYYGSSSSGNESVLKKFNLKTKSYILATCHRQENTDNPERLRSIFGALADLSEFYPVICPVHPRTKSLLTSLDNLLKFKNLKLIEPVGYLEMMQLEKNALVIATDSGGVQKEAYFYKTPCVTLREETEWTELVDSGWNVLCPPTSKEVIVNAVQNSVNVKGDPKELYGNATTANKITEIILGLSK